MTTKGRVVRESGWVIVDNDDHIPYLPESDVRPVFTTKREAEFCNNGGRVIPVLITEAPRRGRK